MTEESARKLEDGYKRLGVEFFERMADQRRYNGVFDLDEIIAKAAEEKE
jgi:hypothetical protein